MTKPISAARRSSRKASTTVRLSPDKVAAAQRILGTRTATETIEAALDMIVLRKALLDGTRALYGLTITPPEA
ncbi:MAG: hypothetical protein IPJ56_16245 [Gemmatimonadetes bacterium]|nr:hypothetical protein [Gemmatimonadota bacterium]